MTKRELVILVADRLGFTQNEVAAVVQILLDTIIESLAQGDRVEIRNFGVFEVKTREARVGRNPRTGQEVAIADKRVVTFKPGKALKEWVQSGDTGDEPIDWDAIRLSRGDGRKTADGPAQQDRREEEEPASIPRRHTM